MEAKSRIPQNRPALEQAIGRLRHCDDALLRHLARQIEKDELSPATAFEMLERFELASLSQLSAGFPAGEAGRDAAQALERRIEILGATLRGGSGVAPTLVEAARSGAPRRNGSEGRPRSSRAAG
ncbi:MAG: hypothetical protein IPN34_17915 [Planctomycetes bacterium]|nr:hypothetical protein [Planctomycetota bacterium]